MNRRTFTPAIAGEQINIGVAVVAEGAKIFPTWVYVRGSNKPILGYTARDIKKGEVVTYDPCEPGMGGKD